MQILLLLISAAITEDERTASEIDIVFGQIIVLAEAANEVTGVSRYYSAAIKNFTKSKLWEHPYLTCKEGVFSFRQNIIKQAEWCKRLAITITNPYLVSLALEIDKFKSKLTSLGLVENKDAYSVKYLHAIWPCVHLITNTDDNEAKMMFEYNMNEHIDNNVEECSRYVRSTVTTSTKDFKSFIAERYCMYSFHYIVKDMCKVVSKTTYDISTTVISRENEDRMKIKYIFGYVAENINSIPLNYYFSNNMDMLFPHQEYVSGRVFWRVDLLVHCTTMRCKSYFIKSLNVEHDFKDGELIKYKALMDHAIIYADGVAIAAIYLHAFYPPRYNNFISHFIEQDPWWYIALQQIQ